jgi:DNA-binding MarR family transcriptional regulator
MNRRQWAEHFEGMTIEIQKKIKSHLCAGIDPAISMPHIFLLSFIKIQGTSIVSDIANHLGVTLSAVTSLVDKLVDMQLVNRRRSEQDRRQVLLEITPEGLDVLSKVEENRDRVLEKSFRGISDEKVKIFFEVHNAIYENIISDDTI